jgi:hypothetical protein
MAVWDVATQRMIVWGGADGGSTRLNSGRIYNPSTDTWSSISTGSVPVGRSNATYTSAISGAQSIVAIRGGTTAMSNADSGGYIYNVTSNSWYGMSGSGGVGAPLATANHAAVWTGTHVLTNGGCDNSSTPRTVRVSGRYIPSSDSWVSTGNSSFYVADPCSVWTGTYMLVWGGRGRNNAPQGSTTSEACNASVATTSGAIYAPF